jgi:hypothetical protein
MKKRRNMVVLDKEHDLDYRIWFLTGEDGLNIPKVVI